MNRQDAIKEHYKDGEASEFLCPTCKTILDYDKNGDFMYCNKCADSCYEMETGDNIGYFQDDRDGEDR